MKDAAHYRRRAVDMREQADKMGRWGADTALPFGYRYEFAVLKTHFELLAEQFDELAVKCE